MSGADEIYGGLRKGRTGRNLVAEERFEAFQVLTKVGRKARVSEEIRCIGVRLTSRDFGICICGG